MAPFEAEFDLEIVAPESVEEVEPGRVYVFFNEFFAPLRQVCGRAKETGSPTLYVADGILEWRNMWEHGREVRACGWAMRPVLAHKVACIGYSQARILESWGNGGKCEVVGIPRFDRLRARQPRRRENDEDATVLVMTAKWPSFSTEQLDRTTRSLLDLRDWFERHPSVNGTAVRPIWRLSGGVEQVIGVENQLEDTTGDDLARVLEGVDAVVSTPSTALLESMLQGVPVALLDYNNCPQYVPTSWSINAVDHIERVLLEILDPSQEKLLFQDTALHDALECRTDSAPRMVELITRMGTIAHDCRQERRPVEFPASILARAGHEAHPMEDRFDPKELFPERASLVDLHRAELEAELAYARLEIDKYGHEVEQLASDLRNCREVLDRIESYPVVKPALKVSRWIRQKLGTGT